MEVIFANGGLERVSGATLLEESGSERGVALADLWNAAVKFSEAGVEGAGPEFVGVAVVLIRCAGSAGPKGGRCAPGSWRYS
jgi:hypothetical protein